MVDEELGSIIHWESRDWDQAVWKDKDLKLVFLKFPSFG